jgi:hypothetical protein
MNGPGIRWTVALAATALLLSACSREATDWKQASAANSIEAYQLFLKQHPHGAEATQAQTRLQQLLEQRDWQIATAANTRDAYQQFVGQHPSSQWAQEARIRIENFAQAGVSGGVAPPGESAAASAGETPASAAAAGTVAPASGSDSASGQSSGVPGTAASTAGSVASASAAPAAEPESPSRTTVTGDASRHTAEAAHHATGHTHALARRAVHGVHGTPAHERRLAREHASSRTVQLGAFRTRAGAQAEWRKLESRFAGLRGLRPSYVAVQARGKRLYRLQVRLSTPAAASGLCATLKRHARSCVRVNA